MSDLNLENIVGFKAVDKDGNEQNVTVDEMVDMVSTRMVMALSETSTFAAAAATGNDVYENELPTVTDAANVRVLQSSGDAAKMTMQSLASKLGELLGNPKGTKSFSSWSEFTDFVNEMPIKTIQPFVSNFNAFAGEGFYGNVVQGLVIKQLEDVVFIFGIAIDGTLIFRKRNYPDVSTWEDPKIIIHSNNWHKIYFVTDLGELIGINDLKRDATIARNSAGANDSYYYNIIPSNVVKCSYLVEILEDRSQPKIYIVSKYYSNYKNDYNVKGVVVGSSMLSVKFFYNDNGDIILSIVASTRSSLVSVKLLCGDSMPSITKIETPSGLTEIPIS